MLWYARCLQASSPDDDRVLLAERWEEVTHFTSLQITWILGLSLLM
jgi:hypothetical protein